jgi:hypothetical protein
MEKMHWPTATSPASTVQKARIGEARLALPELEYFKMHLPGNSCGRRDAA